jgi:hypothetical protein
LVTLEKLFSFYSEQVYSFKIIQDDSSDCFSVNTEKNKKLTLLKINRISHSSLVGQFYRTYST